MAAVGTWPKEKHLPAKAENNTTNPEKRTYACRNALANKRENSGITPRIWVRQKKRRKKKVPTTTQHGGCSTQTIHNEVLVPVRISIFTYIYFSNDLGCFCFSFFSYISIKYRPFAESRCAKETSLPPHPSPGEHAKQTLQRIEESDRRVSEERVGSPRPNSAGEQREEARRKKGAHRFESAPTEGAHSAPHIFPRPANHQLLDSATPKWRRHHSSWPHVFGFSPCYLIFLNFRDADVQFFRSLYVSPLNPCRLFRL